MKILAISLLLLVSVSHAMDPPAIEWYRVYSQYNEFLDVLETPEGFAASTYDAIVYVDQSGNITSEVTSEDFGWHYMKFQSLIPSYQGGLVSTGVGKLASDSSYSLFIAELSSEAAPTWSRNYDYPDATEYGYSVTAFPDSCYVVSGRRSWQAWILMMDTTGDTLWTREWGGDNYDIAAEALYHDNGIIVYTHGNPPETPKGGYLLRYDMDGNLEWQNFIEPMAGKGAQDMCHASDNGLLLLNDTYPLIVHTDYEGNVDWYQTPQGWAQDIGWSINTTMDGGFIVSLDAGNEPGREGIFGVASRHSVSGEIEWWDYVYEGGCSALHCIRQLSEGGYIAAGLGGDGGMLLKYAPETGISEPDPVSSLTMEVTPNPCSSVLSISFSLPDARDASVRIYNLSGRMVSCAAQGEFTAGWNTVEWAVPEELSSGCYFVRYNSDIGSCTESVALIK